MDTNQDDSKINPSDQQAGEMMIHQHHLSNQKMKEYYCTECNKVIITSNFEVHKRTHSFRNLHKYQQCHKDFATSSQLTTHKMIHLGGKCYKCEYCRKGFSRPQDLVRHEIIHTREKPYECSHCTKRFNTSSNLVRHQRLH